MKKTIILLLLLLTNICFSQKLSKEERQLKLEEKKDGSLSQNQEVKLYDFILEEGQLKWQHVYESDMERDELSSYYIKNVLSSMSKDNLNQFEDRITFEIEGDEVDFKKNGGSWGGTPVFVQYPKNYLVVIDLKDYRYRVTIKDIKTDYGNTGLGISDLVDTVSKKRKSVFATSQAIVGGLEYIHKHFLGKFDMEQIKKEADKW